MRFFSLLFLCFQLVAQNVTWTNNTTLVRSYSSPRTTDLNNDGIEDVVIGAGVDGFPTPYGVIAINGNDGSTLWTVTTRNEMFTSPQFFDYNGDNIDDVLIGGRDAELRLIDGQNGNIIWEFWDDENLNPNDYGWYNFYTSQFIKDQNGDGLPDILTANGGDHSLDDSELDRPPGHIMIINGMTGDAIKTAVVPDSNETYMSPLICDLNGDSNQQIIFGTGGETIDGNLWICDLSDLQNEDLSNAIPLIPNSQLGFIAPPAIGDINNDGVLDIVCQGFNGQITAIDGSNYSILWQYMIANTESSASPIIGKFSNTDNELDIFATIFSGGMSSYSDYYQVLIDGATGSELWKDSLGLINFCAPVAFDSNLDGKDEALISVINNNGSYFENELIIIDFVNQTNNIFFGPIAGGNVSCTPQIKDIDNNGFIDLIFSVRADSLNPFGDGTFYENGINTMKISTPFFLPNDNISWGSYMGTNFDGQYNEGCAGDLGLFAFPSQACPGENNGEINLVTTLGLPPYTYLWSNGETTEDLNNLAPGNYSVIVTDANGTCATITREISEYQATFFSQAPSCPGGNDGMAYFSSSGCNCNTSFCQFIWVFDGDTIAQGDGSTATETYKYLFNISAGTYSATIIHPNGCELEQEIIVPEGSLVDDYLITNGCEGDNGGSIDIMVSDLSHTYSWTTLDGTIPLGQENNTDLTGLVAGNYTVTISDTTSCIQTIDFEVGSDYYPYDCNSNCFDSNTTIEIEPLSYTACYGDIITITPQISGGSGNYSYIWPNQSTQNTLDYNFDISNGAVQNVDFSVIDV
ncbi:MAG: hypothetical protein CMP65_03990, partial [Flavobacteriales bacterium]|nr:hypothetical protein [Flavobacteriales bacterium]